jgi:hypothetical protein
MAVTKLKNSVTMNVLDKALKETGPVSLLWSDNISGEAFQTHIFRVSKLFPVLLAKKKHSLTTQKKLKNSLHFHKLLFNLKH